MRAARLRDLLDILPVSSDGLSFLGGEQSVLCFDEIRRCYLDRSDMAVVLLCLAYVERELVAQLYAAGWNRAVWTYKLGGYQVLKKWLSYRDRGVLERALRPQEVLDLMKMAHRDTLVSALWRELGIRPVTLYRYVGRQGQLREQGQRVLAS